MSSGAVHSLYSVGREDLASLSQVLRDSRYPLALRGVDGVTVEVCATDSVLPQGQTLSAPIYDPDGSWLAQLEIAVSPTHFQPCSRKLLQSMLSATGRTLTERWFRAAYRGRWILAVVRDNNPSTYALLAYDSNNRVVAADRNARELLFNPGGIIFPMALAALFELTTQTLRGSQYRDTRMELTARRDGRRWSALMTPPALGGQRALLTERTLGHTRPRLDAMTLATPEPEAEDVRPLSHPAKLRRVQQFIEENLASALNVEQLAQALGISTSHFSRWFRQSVGLPPHSYLMHRRIQKAQDLLVQTNLNLVDVALATGFSDQSHFCRRFQQLTGIPPRAFRLQHR